MTTVNYLDLLVRGDERGQLTVLEGSDCFPHGIKRVYYLTGTKEGVSRGFHAHKELEQLAVCVSGSCRMILDDGLERVEVVLKSSSQAVEIPKMIWHEMHDFTPDCILLVMASDIYDESDYIRSYKDFIGLCENAKNSSTI